MTYCALSAIAQTELALHIYPVLHPLCSQQIKDGKACHASTNIKNREKDQQVSYIILNKVFQNAIKLNSFGESDCQCAGKTNLL